MNFLPVIAYTLISLYIAWVWIDYFRMIDVFRKNELIPTLIVFFLGMTSPWLVFLKDHLFPDFSFFNLGKSLPEDLLYCTFDIGLVEEICKLLPFLALWAVWGKHFEEPIDYVYFMSISALGFSCLENIFYFISYGPTIIDGRSILSTVGHMFDSSIMAYGIVKLQFRGKKYAFLIFPLYLLFAALSHGVYDLFAIRRTGFGFLMTSAVFMFTVSIYSTVINNCLNISQHFTYKFMIDQWHLIARMLKYYISIFLIQFSLMLYFEGIPENILGVLINALMVGFIILVVVIRLSRFKLIRGRWNSIRLELPFSVSWGGIENPMSRRLVIKGDGFSEVRINRYYQEKVSITPLTMGRTHLGETKTGFIEEKVFDLKDNSYYILRIDNEVGKPVERYMIVPKRMGSTTVAGKYPIVGLLRMPEKEILPEGNNFTKLGFLEWVSLKD